jgi:mannose-6-phosphate isomerase-like protein (cupin superfamily)
MTVNPGEILSLQSHEHRSEFWYVAEGVATVECDGNVFDLKKHESTHIPLKSKHRLSNNSNEVLKVIEVQIGDVLSEEDISRYEDRYERD